MTASRIRVYISPMFGQVGADRMAELRSAAPDAELRLFDTAAELEAVVEDATVVAAQLSEPAFARARSLRWLHSWLAGPDHQLFPTLIDTPVVFTCSKGNGAIPLAEHALMLMLMLNRQAMTWIDNQRQRRWQRFTHSELCGRTLGILGTGHSGVDLARKAQAFHMRVVGLRRSAAPLEFFDRMYAPGELHDFLAECDVLVNAAPLTPQTRGLLGEAEFRAMKKGAHYICFSRGGIADDGALLKALDEGWLGGAGLDAHSVEPLPPDSPFWTAPNTIVTPHNGATTEATHDRAYAIFRDNLRRFVSGGTLENVVDKANGY